MDRWPLLYVHVGLPVQPTKAAWWPWLLTFWPLKWFPSHLWRGLPLCQIWSSYRPLHSRLRPDVRDRQTSDVRQHHRLMPHGQGIIIIIMGLVKLIKFLNTLACAVVLRIKSHTRTHTHTHRERETRTRPIPLAHVLSHKIRNVRLIYKSVWLTMKRAPAGGRWEASRVFEWCQHCQVQSVNELMPNGR